MHGVKALGFNALALQADTQADGSTNAPWALAVKSLCEANDILYGIWESFPSPEIDRVTSFGADFYIGEGERFEDWQFITDIFRLKHPTMPAACVTNFNLTDFDVSSLHRADFDCLGESYTPENPQATPEAQAFEAQRRGWFANRFQPVIMVNAKNPLSSYEAILKPFPSYWVWSAEYVL